MNLAKALKLKNRLIQNINELQSEVQRNNSYREDGIRKIDTHKSMEDLVAATEKLIKLKISIFVASTPMRENILRLGELKSRIQFLKGINTTEGYVDNYDGKTLYSVEYDVSYIKNEVKTCESLIDELQEELDKFNHTTEIEIEVNS